MLSSMTGFSTITVALPTQTAEQLHITLSLRSLNSRFFEAVCKLPYALSSLEIEIIKRCKAKLYRGSIHCTLHIGNPQVLKAQVRPSLPVIESYIKASELIRQKFNLPGKLSLATLFNLPHVFETAEELADEHLASLILYHVDRLIDELSAARLKEGEALQRDLEERIAVMRMCIERIEPRATDLLAEQKEQLMGTLSSFLHDTQTEAKEQQLQVIYNQLDKMVIHEEIIRFKDHLHKLEQVIVSSREEKGKKLDFFLQELFREVNTMMAKSRDAEISSLAIAIKVELEKVREQAQNIV